MVLVLLLILGVTGNLYDEVSEWLKKLEDMYNNQRFDQIAELIASPEDRKRFWEIVRRYQLSRPIHLICSEAEPIGQGRVRVLIINKAVKETWTTLGPSMLLELKRSSNGKWVILNADAFLNFLEALISVSPLWYLVPVGLFSLVMIRYAMFVRAAAKGAPVSWRVFVYLAFAPEFWRKIPEPPDKKRSGYKSAVSEDVGNNQMIKQKTPFLAIQEEYKRLLDLLGSRMESVELEELHPRAQTNLRRYIQNIENLLQTVKQKVEHIATQEKVADEDIQRVVRELEYIKSLFDRIDETWHTH